MTSRKISTFVGTAAERQARAQQRAAAQRQASLSRMSPDQRAQVLDRHRREWAAPRKLSYEAVQSRDFEKAKLAKITAETLQIIQANERKAWGIEQGDGDSNVFVIERG